MVTEFVVDSNGQVSKHQIYPALVINKAQLAYPSVGAWLEGTGRRPPRWLHRPNCRHNSNCRTR